MGLLYTFNKVTTVQYHSVSQNQEQTFELFKHNPQNSKQNQKLTTVTLIVNEKFYKYYLIEQSISNRGC